MCFRFTFLLAVLALSAAAQQLTPEVLRDDPDIAVIYAKVIPAERRDKVVVAPTTGNPKICDEYGRDSGVKLDFEEAVADYRRVNSKTWNVESVLRTIPGVQIVPQRESKQNWKRIQKSHPGVAAYMTLSAVGFNRTRTIAVVYMAFFCGADCGGGQWYFYKRGEKGWEETNPPFQNCEWMS